MNDREERPAMAVSVPMSSSGPGMNPSMGVAAPLGTVSRKDQGRAARTALEREGASALVLVTALPGSVMLQRQDSDETWETLHARPAPRSGRTRLELPDDATSSSAFRVVFSPKNANIPSWVSETIDA